MSVWQDHCRSEPAGHWAGDPAFRLPEVCVASLRSRFWPALHWTQDGVGASTHSLLAKLRSGLELFLFEDE